MRPAAALGADRGLTALVGAGGLERTLFALAADVDRALVTATAPLSDLDDRVATVVASDSPLPALRAAGSDDWPLGVVAGRSGDDYRGLPPETVTAVAAEGVADAVVVAADDDRGHLLTAPDDGDPSIPAVADTVVPVASARAVGAPLDGERVRRPERVAGLTGRAVGAPLTAGDVATVLTHREGCFCGVPPAADVVPLLTAVEGGDAAAARDVARAAADAPHVERVVLLSPDRSVVDVVGRQRTG
jgi:probable selenium-dependent hydroxylase accessory protein YqeC